MAAVVGGSEKQEPRLGDGVHHCAGGPEHGLVSLPGVEVGDLPHDEARRLEAARERRVDLEIGRPRCDSVVHRHDSFGWDAEFDQLPPDLFAALTALAAFTSALPEAEQFAFDPLELGTTDEGVLEMVSRIGQMGRDKKLLRAVKQQLPAEAEAPVEEAPVESPDDVDGFIQ